MDDNNQSKVYTVAQAAAALGVKPISIYRLLQRGKLRALAGLRHKKIPKKEIDRFLSEG